MPQDQVTGALHDGTSGASVAEPALWNAVLSWTTVSWVAQIVVSLVLLQTLYFKFTYAPETQVIFADRGGRPAATAAGIIELICAVLLLVPRWSSLGALLSLLVISGAILTHLTSLGVEITDPKTGQGDRGFLFGLAILVAFGSVIVLSIRWRQLPWIGALLFQSP